MKNLYRFFWLLLAFLAINGCKEEITEQPEVQQTAAISASLQSSVSSSTNFRLLYRQALQNNHLVNEHLIVRWDRFDSKKSKKITTYEFEANLHDVPLIPSAQFKDTVIHKIIAIEEDLHVSFSILEINPFVSSPTNGYSTIRPSNQFEGLIRHYDLRGNVISSETIGGNSVNMSTLATLSTSTLDEGRPPMFDCPPEGCGGGGGHGTTVQPYNTVYAGCMNQYGNSDFCHIKARLFSNFFMTCYQRYWFDDHPDEIIPAEEALREDGYSQCSQDVVYDHIDCDADPSCSGLDEFYVLADEIGANGNQAAWLRDNPAVECFIREQIDNAPAQDKPFVKDIATAYIDIFNELHGSGDLQPEMLNLFDTVCNATVSAIVKNKLLQILPQSIVAIESCMLYNVGKREYQYQRDELGRQKAGAIYWTFVKLHQHAFDRMAEYKDAVQQAVNDLNIQLPQTAEEWEALGGLMISFIAQNWVYLVPVYGDILTLIEEFNTIISTGQVTAGSALNIGASVLGLFPVSKVATITAGITGIVVTGVKSFKYIKPVVTLGIKALKVKARARLVGASLRFVGKSGDEVARVVGSTWRISKHGITPKQGSVVFRKADDVNAEILSQHPNWDPPYHVDMPPVEYTSLEFEQFVRVWNHSNGNNTGGFVVKLSEIQNLTPSQIQSKLAIDDVPTRIRNVNVPANFKLRTGKVAPRPSINAEGGLIQFELIDHLTATHWGPVQTLN